MGVVTVGELKPSILGERSLRPSSSTRHVTECPIADVYSDLTIEVGAASSACHKVHPNIKDSERYRLCKTTNCQKLSQKGCNHAAQNKRLPVMMAIQVVYFEQIRLQNAMNGGRNQFFFVSVNGRFPQHSGSRAGSGCISPQDNYASERREKRELKLKVAITRMRLTDLEKDHVLLKQELIVDPANKLFWSFAKKLSKLNALFQIYTYFENEFENNVGLVFLSLSCHCCC